MALSAKGEGGETWRMFVAVDLPDPVRRAVRAQVDVLEAAGADVRWVPGEQLHVTCKFLGDVVRARVDSVRDALRAIPSGGALELELRGLGRFPPPRRGAPRVFWLGIEGEVDRLVDLAAAVDAACAVHGVARERRPFTPHLTIGRVRSGRNLRALEALVEQRAPEVAIGPTVVETFRLYRSELRPDGALHTAIEEFPT